jgi:hypothetical protein
MGMFTVTPTLEIYPKARYAILKEAFLSAVSSPQVLHTNNPCVLLVPRWLHFLQVCDVQFSYILITLIPAKAALYVKYSVNLKYGNPESFLLNFLPLPLPFFFSWFRNPLSLPNTINESVSIARLTISLVILCMTLFTILFS